jgi:hypothetical protein
MQADQAAQAAAKSRTNRPWRGRRVLLVLGAVVVLAAGALAVFFLTRPERAAPVVTPPPDLRHIAAALSDPNPAVRQKALATALRTPGTAARLLPAGAVAVPDPGSWQVTGRDGAGAGVTGSAVVTVTTQGKRPTSWLLLLEREGGEWFVYGTRPG